MITIKQAIELYSEKNPTFLVDGIIDVGDEWVISARDKETGLEIDASPLAINKETGAFRVFFPPKNAQKLANAKKVSLEEITHD